MQSVYVIFDDPGIHLLIQKKIFQQQQNVFRWYLLQKETQVPTPAFVFARMQAGHARIVNAQEIRAQVDGEAAIGPKLAEEVKERFPEIAVSVTRDYQH
jgi:hypothetical protein